MDTPGAPSGQPLTRGPSGPMIPPTATMEPMTRQVAIAMQNTPGATLDRPTLESLNQRTQVALAKLQMAIERLDKIALRLTGGDALVPTEDPPASANHPSGWLVGHDIQLSIMESGLDYLNTILGSLDDLTVPGGGTPRPAPTHPGEVVMVGR